MKNDPNGRWKNNYWSSLSPAHSSTVIQSFQWRGSEETRHSHSLDLQRYIIKDCCPVHFKEFTRTNPNEP